MTDALDMSLDDLIKSNRKSNSRGRGGGGGGGRPPRSSGSGPARRFPNRGANRAGPYSKPAQAPDTTWQHDMFMETATAAAYPARVGRPSSIETGTKLYISNLDYGVSNEDIKELFSEVGDIKRYSVHYDRSGRSEGTADVVFARREDAVAAVKRYNNVQLDGKPMKIEIVGTNITSRPAFLPPGDGMNQNQNSIPRSASQGRVGAMGRLRGGGGVSGGVGGGRGARRGRGRGRGPVEKVSAEDLDADLEKYHSEAMQEN